jgi:hypothetical protein
MDRSLTHGIRLRDFGKWVCVALKGDVAKEGKLLELNADALVLAGVSETIRIQHQDIQQVERRAAVTARIKKA